MKLKLRVVVAGPWDFATSALLYFFRLLGCCQIQANYEMSWTRRDDFWWNFEGGARKKEACLGLLLHASEGNFCNRKSTQTTVPTSLVVFRRKERCKGRRRKMKKRKYGITAVSSRRSRQKTSSAHALGLVATYGAVRMKKKCVTTGSRTRVSRVAGENYTAKPS